MASSVFGGSSISLMLKCCVMTMYAAPAADGRPELGVRCDPRKLACACVSSCVCDTQTHILPGDIQQ